MLGSFSQLMPSAGMLAQSTHPAGSNSLRWIADGSTIFLYMLVMAWTEASASSRHKGDTHDYFAAGGRIRALGTQHVHARGDSSRASLSLAAYPRLLFMATGSSSSRASWSPSSSSAPSGSLSPSSATASASTAYEYFERRFSYGSRPYASLASAVLDLTKTGSAIYLLAVAFNVRLTGIPEC